MIKVFCQAFFQKSRQKSRESNVQTCILGVALNELLAGFHLLAHQDAERLVGALGIFDLDLHDHAVIRLPFL